MESLAFLLCLSVFITSQSMGLPKRIFYSDLNAAPSYMLGAGYYRKPSFGENYYPGSLSAVVTKDIVATNSYAGSPLSDYDSREHYTEKYPVGQGENQDISHNKKPELSLEEDTAVGESPTTDNRNTNTNKRRGRKPIKNNDDDDNDNSELPWAFGRGGPSYTSFFPININGGGGIAHRSRNTAGNQDDIPYDLPSGSATAIANAFSTGRGGVANSHATSFGDPYFAAKFLRSGMNNVRGYKEY